MINRVRHAVAPIVSVAAVVFFTVLTGCEKDSGTVAPQDRMQDKAYLDDLKEGRKAELEIIKRQRPLQANMERMRERARAVLGKDATEAQIVAELDGNPGKYPGWRELKASAAEADKALKKTRAEMRERVRARILKEAADQKAAKATK